IPSIWALAGQAESTNAAAAPSAKMWCDMVMLGSARHGAFVRIGRCWRCSSKHYRQRKMDFFNRNAKPAKQTKKNVPSASLRYSMMRLQFQIATRLADRVRGREASSAGVGVGSGKPPVAPGERGLEAVAARDVHELRLVGRARALDRKIDRQRLFER